MVFKIKGDAPEAKESNPNGGSSRRKRNSQGRDSRRGQGSKGSGHHSKGGSPPSGLRRKGDPGPRRRAWTETRRRLKGNNGAASPGASREARRRGRPGSQGRAGWRRRRLQRVEEAGRSEASWGGKGVGCDGVPRRPGQGSEGPPGPGGEWLVRDLQTGNGCREGRCEGSERDTARTSTQDPPGQPRRREGAGGSRGVRRGMRGRTRAAGAAVGVTHSPGAFSWAP